MLRRVHDRTLPDHSAFLAAEPKTGRVIVIAPTRAACETIELALGLHIDTLLERQHGTDIRNLARGGKGFGIVAGTGTGKTLAIRPIAEEILGTRELRVGVVNREREATPETPTWNVIIVPSPGLPWIRQLPPIVAMRCTMFRSPSEPASPPPPCPTSVRWLRRVRSKVSICC